MILQFSPDNSKCVVYKVMINVDLKLGGDFISKNKIFLSNQSDISTNNMKKLKVKYFSPLIVRDWSRRESISC